MKISVYTTCQDAIDNEFTLFEGMIQALQFCDEFIYVDSGSTDGTMKYMELFAERDSRIKIYKNYWDESKGKAMYPEQKNVALSKCTGDWCCLLDADEVYGDIFPTLIRTMLLNWSTDFVGLRCNTLHFYADYKHICFKDPIKGYDWYDKKDYIFRNGLGVHHSVVGEDVDALVDVRDYNLMGRTYAVDFPIYHYGHVRSIEKYQEKKNIIERRFHPDWKSITDFKYEDVGNRDYIRVFNGNHPIIMSGRVGLKCPIDHKVYMLLHLNWLNSIILQRKDEK